MTLALVLPVLGGADAHVERALDELGADALSAARVRDAFLGAGELVLVYEAGPDEVQEAVTSQDARPLVRVLEEFTAFESVDPLRFAIRPVSDASSPVSPKPSFSTGSG